MTKTKLFGLSFLMAFVSTAWLCMIGRHPLIYMPVSYGFHDFLLFAFLIGVLSFGLVFINLSFLTLLKRRLKLTISEKSFYVVSTLAILQLLTLMLGYMESNAFSGDGADLYYYYKGIGNSRVYIFTGNVTATVIATLYAKQQAKVQKEGIFNLDSEHNR